MTWLVVVVINVVEGWAEPSRLDTVVVGFEFLVDGSSNVIVLLTAQKTKINIFEVIFMY